jgi:uncharacterized protein (DUF362 family)
MASSDNDGRGCLGRRDFLVGTAAVVGGALVGCSDDSQRPGREAGADARPPSGDARGEGKSGDAAACADQPTPLPAPTGAPVVADVSDPKSISSTGVIDATRVQDMLKAGLLALASQTDIKQAWKTLLPEFAASMRIGLKVNCLSAALTSSAALCKALIQTLVQDLGADSSKILVWDRRTDELTRGKLTEASLGAKVGGTLVSLKDSSGPGYETQATCCLTRPVHLSRILTEQTDITINLSLLKTHYVSGVTGALKNVYGCIAEPGSLHDDFSHHMPALYRLDRLRKSFRLHITEGLAAVTRGDTADPIDTTPGRLLLSQDPLALDVQSLAVINKLRDTLPPVDTALLGWIDEADRLHLGSKTPSVKSVAQP